MRRYIEYYFFLLLPSLVVALILATTVAFGQQAYTLFGTSVPASPSEADPNAVTLGLKFYTTQPGTISAIRFYRGHSNSHGYTARLYTAAGALLGQVILPSDASTSGHPFVAGWKTATFAAPISINANASYIVAYYSSNGDYGATEFGLTGGAMNGPLIAPADAQAGGNGVYAYGGGFHFPTFTYQASNYFVDVAFTPSAPPPPTLSLVFTPASPSVPPDAAPGAVVATVAATWSDGSPFTGTYSFTSPYSDDNMAFSLSANSGPSVNLIVNPAGPGLSNDADTVQSITVAATQ